MAETGTRTEAFDWLTASADESVLWSGQPRTRQVLAWAILLAVLAVGSLLVDLRAGVAVAVLGPLLLGGWYLHLRNVHYVLTDRSVYRKSGVLGETVERADLSKVQNTDLSKGIVGAQLDFGTVSISTAGGGGPEIRIAKVNDPEQVQRLLDEHVKRAAGGGVGTATGGGYDRESVQRLRREARKLRETAESLEETLGGRS